MLGKGDMDIPFAQQRIFVTFDPSKVKQYLRKYNLLKMKLRGRDSII